MRYLFLSRVPQSCLSGHWAKLTGLFRPDTLNAYNFRELNKCPTTNTQGLITSLAKSRMMNGWLPYNLNRSRQK